jgi:hypothetical protein
MTSLFVTYTTTSRLSLFISPMQLENVATPSDSFHQLGKGSVSQPASGTNFSHRVDEECDGLVPSNLFLVGKVR